MDPVSEIVSEAECAANVTKSNAGGQHRGRPVRETCWYGDQP